MYNYILFQAVSYFGNTLVSVPNYFLFVLFNLSFVPGLWYPCVVLSLSYYQDDRRQSWGLDVQDDWSQSQETPLLLSPSDNSPTNWQSTVGHPPAFLPPTVRRNTLFGSIYRSLVFQTKILFFFFILILLAHKRKSFGTRCKKSVKMLCEDSG